MSRGNREAEVDPAGAGAAQPTGSPGSPGSTEPTVVSEKSRAAAFSRARFAALARLLEDDSPTVWREVRRQLLSAGKRALPMLRRAARHSPSPRARSRARALLLARERKFIIRRLIRYVMRPEIDLELALLMLSRHHTPGLDIRPYRKALDGLASGLMRRCASCENDYERCMALCEYLGQELKFGGDLDDYHHPDNVHLHRAIERNTGMPLTLTAIYMSVARRVDLKVAPLPLPGHVMLRARGGDKSVIIDPFHNGHVRTERECLQYLAQNGLKFRSEWFRDADDRTMFERQVRNLSKSYEMRGLRAETRGLDLLAEALARFER